MRRRLFDWLRHCLSACVRRLASTPIKGRVLRYSPAPSYREPHRQPIKPKARPQPRCRGKRDSNGQHSR